MVPQVLDYLVVSKKIDASARERVEAEFSANGRQLEPIFLSLGLMEEADLLAAISKVSGIRFVSHSSQISVDQAAYDQLGGGVWADKSMLPVITETNEPAILTSRPFDREAWAEIEFLIRETRVMAIATSGTIREVQQTAIRQNKLREKPLPVVRSESSDPDGAAAKAIDAVFSRCIELGASDIHLTRQDSDLNIQARVHGRLQPVHIAHEVEATAFFSRLKLIGGMNIVERRLPQDGGCQFNHGGRLVELRMSTLPIPNGETFVCRIMDQTYAPDNFEALGFSIDDDADIKRAIERPFGLLVVAGPTGSGKTTTLYTALRQLADGTRKIISAEDPIEQQIPGVTQVQVDNTLGLSFGKILRTSLRHDPDVLMIGEVRDEETAEIACRAALVGRLVLATVHANSARLVRERFINLGVPGYLVDEVLIAVISQRLERKICVSCTGTGCEVCGNSGASGRVLKSDIMLGDLVEF